MLCFDNILIMVLYLGSKSTWLGLGNAQILA